MNTKLPNNLPYGEFETPVLPLRDVVIFPGSTMPLYVGRTKSLKAIQAAMAADGRILVVAQRDPSKSEPAAEDLHTIGTFCFIRQETRLSDGNVKLLVEALERVRIRAFLEAEPFHRVRAEIDKPITFSLTSETNALLQTLLQQYKIYQKLVGKPVEGLFDEVRSADEALKLLHLVAAQMSFKVQDRQELLELNDLGHKLERCTELIVREIEFLKIDRRIKTRVREQIEKTQRDYYLNEQLNAIHKELGHDLDPREELQALEKRLKEKQMPEAARERAEKELKKLKLSNGHPAEAAVVRNYLDLILDLPWLDLSKDDNSLPHANEVLNEDHHGLVEVKERILDFLAVRSRVENPKSPILCLVGPPGVGKTSLARSVARALDRKFERISLGGVRDEAELRGHRRTYIGALPGKIIAALRKVKTSNPVILLDEVDKLGSDFRGDPASALLEILDPEQNKHFSDHYLDLEYDLSKVLFIATANQLDSISAPLKDRMEIIRISGYTELEKIAIAQKFLIPREKQNHGLEALPLQLSEENLQFIIRSYTKEAGVRSLQKEIAKICRKYLRKLSAEDEAYSPQFNNDLLKDYLGVPRFHSHLFEQQDLIGVVSGLAWTPYGGEVLTVEASVVPGKGRIQITGQLGSVMQESAQAALSYIRSRADRYKIPADFFGRHDIHVHVPEGAIPKDGPSAGITMATAILSAILQIPVRHQISMTGEITLRGRVLPIGGLKEKSLAAQAAGFSKILFPIANERDKSDLEMSLLKELEFVSVQHMDEVVDAALNWNEARSKKPVDAGVELGLRKDFGEEAVIVEEEIENQNPLPPKRESPRPPHPDMML